MMKTEHLYRVASFAAVAVMGACATAPIPYKTPVSVTPPTGRIAVSQAVTIFDASGSQATQFSDGKATLESIVAAMPDGRYEAGNIHFGGSDREMTGVSGFSRPTLAAAANGAQFLEGTSPLYSVFEDELGAAIGNGSGRAAVVVISDGLATDYAGRSGAEDRTLAAARAVASNRSGEVCYHTVQSGDSVEGAAFMQSLAKVTSCGSYRKASSLGTASALQQFSRSVYLSDETAPAKRTPEKEVAAALPDSDGDGVVDPKDACPGTLKQAKVDSRGCWELHDLRFDVNGAGIAPEMTSALRQDLDVLKANPNVRIRIDGYTDSDGSAAYNQNLSERRAASTRDFFVSQGLKADRFEIKGFGEENPIVPNDSKENKRTNRRVELTILD